MDTTRPAPRHRHRSQPPVDRDGAAPDPVAGTASKEASGRAADTNGRASDTSGRAAEDGARSAGCTQAQLRRFIKSRPYVPMHELRRRFELNGQADDVTPIAGPDGTMWIGLPDRESGFVAELLRQGDIGVELCRDPSVAIVVGVFPIRPVSR